MRSNRPARQGRKLMEARNKFFNITMAVILAFTMVPVMAFASDDGDGGAQGGGSGDAIVSTDGSGNGGSLGSGTTGTGTGDGATGGSVTDGTGTGSDNGTAGTEPSGSVSIGDDGSTGPTQTGTEPGNDDSDGDGATTGVDDGTASGTEGGQPGEGGTSDGNTPADGGSSATVRDAQDWTGLLDDLKLDASLQFADPDPTLSPAYGIGDEGAAQSGSESADPAESGDLSAADGDQGSDASDQNVASVLPDFLSATLTVQIELDPQDQDAFVRTGDWFRLTLPDGFALADASATADVVAVDDQGNATETRVGKASLVNGQLKVEFASDAPESALSEEALAQATQEQAQAALVKMPASADGVLRAQVELQVTVDGALLSDQPSTIEWVLQQGSDGTVQTALLELPARSELEQLWQQALDSVQPAQSVESAEAETPEAAISSVKQALAVARAELQSTTTYQVSLNEQVSSIITWCDNNYGSRPSTDSLENGFIPYYAEQGTNDYKPLIEKDQDGRWFITGEAMKELHLKGYEQLLSTLPLVDITQTATNTYEVLSHALPGEVTTTVKSPSLDDDGNPIYNEDGEQTFYYDSKTVHYDWKLIDTNTYEGYVDGTNSKWDHQYKMLTGDVEFNVIGKVGGEKLSNIFGDAEADDFRFSASIDNKPVEQDISVAEAIEQGLLEITDGVDGTTCVVSGTLPVYDENGYPIVYYIQYTGEQNTDDYYQPTYDNAESANHSSDTTAVYSGGTMTLRHAGTTEYYGTKQWLDDGNTETRPSVTFTLWRYSLNGGSAATASQVTLSQDTAVSGGTSSNSAASYVQVTLPAGSDSTVDLHKLLVDTYGDAIDQLPKYDPDGYPYVYALREEAISGYEQVFGSVAEDGTVNDTPPTYELPGGTWTSLDSTERPSNDRFVYNAGNNENEGVISNRVTGTTTTEMTKSWEIAAFQDDLQDVMCEFTAQCRVKGSDGEWQNVDADNAVQTITGWNAETLVKTITGTFPKYDAHGNELEYRWVESDVTLEGQTTNFESDGNGGGTFTIDMVDAEGNPETLEFTSKPTTTVGDDGSYSTDIVNTFNNITYQRVDKYWEQPDGTLAQIAPDPAYDDGVAKVELYQDGVRIGTFELDGKTDSDATPVEGIDGATWQETSSYHGDFENLPKYSPDGVHYNYLVLEVKKDNWHSDRTYDPDTRTTRIDNYFPEGEGSEIRVTKYWLDGDDAAHRLKVRAQLIALEPMESKAKDENGDPLYEYDEGQAVSWIDDDGVLHDTFDLTSAELWYAEIDVPIGGLDYKDFEVREVALVDDKGTEDTSDDVVYEVLTRDKAQEQRKGEAWVNAAWTNPDNRRVATDQHVYEVKSRYNESMRSCEITNRRLGLLDITVSKEWKDGLGADEDKTRPEATLTLSCLEYDNAFSLDAEGNLQVSVSGNTLAITDADGNPVKAIIVNDDDNDGHGSAQVTVDTTKATSEYVFKGLPKYDADGLNVHYTVEEDWKADEGDYRSSKTKDEYTVEPNERHFQDTQDIDFVNSRTGTRDAVFYKNWHDAYVNDTLKQRPDIYLTLWQVSGDNEPKQVDGYTHYTWSAADEGGDATNNQKVTITDLPKYDSEGYEITYYATETMSADGTSLGYGDATFDYTTIGDDVPENEHAIKVDDQAKSSPDESTVGWALHEGGTFVNTLTGTLTANGTKLWENIPGNVLQKDLPEVTVYLQQKLETDAEWPDMYLVKDDEGEWVVAEGAVAETSELTEVATNQYTYTITADYEGDALPRYNEDGNLYQYRAVEVIWGLYNQPGGFTDKELDPDNNDTSINLTDVREGAGEDNPLNKHIFIIQHGETGSFLLRNIYSTGTDKGNLTVKKLFSGRDTTDTIYPDVTYTVYRYYVNGNGVESAAQAVASHTITQADFRASTTGEEGNRSATYTFENLEVYAPDGSLWVYYVTETDINGYETTVGVGDLALESDQLKEGTDADGATQSPDLGTFQDGKITDSVLEDDTNVDVTFANKYNPESADLKGTKKWDDFNNIFSVRPTEMLGLTFTRTAGDVTESVTTQSDTPDEVNYLNWTASGETDDWTFELSNIEKWAPNGQAWTYTVTEKLPSGAESYYTIVTGTSQVASTSTTGFKLENALNGQATVEKKWVDGGDPYGLRPETVTVELQARYVKVDGSGTVQGNYSEWKNAYEVWKNFASENDLNKQGFTADSVMRTLQVSNGWKGSWQKLPLIARLNADSDLNKIEYRVVETKIGDSDTVIASPSEDGTYETYHPYQPSQATTTSDDDIKSSTSITNTLETTSVQATKSWSNDTVNNVEDAWGTRPADGNNWVATFFLQQRLEGAGDDAWAWVVEAGAEPATSAADDGVVSFTISDGMTGDDNHVVVKNDDSVTVTWKNLPDCDENGVKYEYRIVEQVPGSYDVKNATEVEDADTAHRYYVVSSVAGAADADPDSQFFDNELRTVSLTGTKKWNDYGTGFAPAFDSNNAPKMVLYRQVGDDTTTAEKVTMKNGTDPAQPTWTVKGDGTWTFTYTGLPAADENDRAYTYWAEEQAGSGNTDGFYPTYGTADGAGTTAGNGAQTNTDITNVATRFTLDKLSDWNGSDGNPERLNGIELSVVAGGKTYAVWERDANGNVTTWVDPAGGATKDDVKADAHKMTAEGAAGYIVGLHDGTYTVTETGTVPAGYAKAPDVSITISADGKVTSTTQGAVENGNKPGVDTVITVDVVDPVLRGHLELTKLVSDNGNVDDVDAAGLKGATFDLYRVDCDGDGKDELIAKGLTSADGGKVTTVGNGTAIEKTASGGTFDLTYDGKYTKLSDGLPEGEYYFLETNATPGAVMPEGEAAKSEVLEITQSDHYATTNAPVRQSMGNVEFNANISLIKRDADSGTDPLAGISGATFKLEYKAEGSTGGYVNLGSYSTDKNGLLSISDLEKGDYRLTETSNKGYVVTDDNRFVATFTLEDDDDDRVFDVNSKGAWDAIDFKVEQGELLDGSGVLNHRQTGEVTLNKRGSNTAIDATFELQMKVGDEWKTVATGLETGNSYELTFNGDGVTATADDTGDLSTGQLKVTGLTWNTYRFQETETAPGYLPENGNGPVTSSEFTINRDNAASTNVGVTVPNAQTDLRINKQGPTGEALNGAKFTVTPVDGSKFADGTADAKTLTTENSGYATLKGQLVVGGTYEIYEVAGPSSYDPVDESFRVFVEDNGRLKVVDDQGQETELPDGYQRTDIDGTGTDAFSFLATNQPMAIKLTKMSSADTGKTLEGASFRLLGECMDKNTTHDYETDGNGLIEITAGLMGGVKYTLIEDAAPSGYITETAQSISFYMDDRGEILPVDENDDALSDDQLPAGWTVNGDRISFTMENDPVELQITKLAPAGEDGSQGAALEGAVFSVTPVEGSTFADGSFEAVQLTTDGNGAIKMTAQLMVGGTYDITEVTAPEGYEKVEGTMRVKVADDGSIGVLGSVGEDGKVDNQQPPAGYTKVDGSSFEVQVVNQPIEIGLVKMGVNDTATPLAAAQFQITGTFAGGTEQETRTFSTNADGTLAYQDQALENLSAVFVAGNEYTIVETAAPGGYKIIDGKLTFKVTEGGQIETTGQTAQPGQPGFAIGADNVTIMALDEPFEIQLTKLGSDTGDEPLNGAVFELTGVFANADGSLQEASTRVIDVAGGAATIDGLVASGGDAVYEYQLVETVAPNGYEKAAGILAFTIDAQGNVAVKEGSLSQGYAVAEGSAFIAVTDEPHLVSLVKRAPNGDPLEGARFTVEGPFLDGERSKEFASDAQGTVFEGLQLAGSAEGVAYTVTETQAPEGYQLPEQSMQLLVFDDGTVKVADPQSTDLGRRSDVSQDGGTVVVSVKNEPTPGTLFAKTGDLLGAAGLGALGAAAIAAAGIGVRRVRRRMAAPGGSE